MALKKESISQKNKSTELSHSTWLTTISQIIKKYRTGVYILASIIVLIGSLFATYSYVSHKADVAKAANVYSCPNGGTQSGTNCVAANKAFSCPRGGAIQGTNCVATTANPVDNTSLGCFLGGTPQNSHFGRGGEAQFESFICRLPITVVASGGRGGNTASGSFSPTYRNIIPLIGCPAPSAAGWHTQVLSKPDNSGVDRYNSTFYLNVDNVNNTFICGGFNPAGVNPNAPACGGHQLGCTNSCNVMYNGCAVGSYNGEYFYWPGGVYSNYSYPAAGGCPLGWSDAGGPNCYYVATVTNVPTTIGANNVGNSQNCNNTLTITIPDKYTCIFGLSGDSNNSYTLPSGGISASTSTATGNSDACTVDAGYVPMTTWFMNGTAYSGNARFLTQSVDKNWFAEAGGDFNKDGNPDLVWRNNTAGQTVIWLLDANQNILPNGGINLPSFGAGEPWSFPAIGDFDGDGNADIVWRNQTTGQTNLWKMNGTTLASNTLLTDQVASPDWIIEGAGDFNGDGKADLFWHNHSTGQLVMWYMNGVTRTSSVILTSTVTDPNFYVRAVADFSGDGKPDLLWHNAVTGSLSIWEMNNSTFIKGDTLPSVGAPWYPWGAADFNKDGKKDIFWRQFGVDGTPVLRCSNIPTTSGTAGLRDVILSANIGDKGDVNLINGTTVPTLGTISGGGLTGTIGGPAGGTVTTTGGNYNGPANYTNGTGCTIAGTIASNVFTPSANVGAGCPVGSNTSGGLTATGTGTLPSPITTGVASNFTAAPYTITGPNIGTGTCSPASINIGGTTTCTYPLVNIPTGQTPVLPTTPVTDSITTATGVSSACTIGSGNTTLVCTNVPSTSGTAGSRTATPNLTGSGSAPVTLVANACTNGATNPTACDQCPTGQTLVSGTCVANCTNGTNNPPACNACPTGKTLVNNVCATIITPGNIGNSSDCTSSKSVIIPNTYICNFPLTGDTGNNYALPTGGIKAGTSTATGLSPDCTIQNPGTSSVSLQCTSIPTTSGTPGAQNVLLTVGTGGTPTDKGDVTLVDPNYTITGPNIGAGTCFPASINIGSTTTCTYPLVNIPTGRTPQLPTGGVTDSITTATGNNTCQISGTNLVCTNLPSTGGTAGNQSATPSLTGSGTAPVALVQSACTNGATNPPTCNQCPSGQTLVSNTCVANCTNGAINPPACNQCPSGQIYQNNRCEYPITGSNIGAGTCSPSSIAIGATTNCTYPLINLPTGVTPGLPTGGVTDSITTATGNTPCTISGTNLVCASVPSTGGSAGNQNATPSLSGSGSAPVTLTPATTTTPTITCNGGQAVLANTTTTCTYTLPTGTTLTPGTQLGIGDATPAGSCTQTGQTVTCTGVPTGSQTGSQPIYVQTPGAAKTDSGSKATVTSPTITCNNGNAVLINSTTTCTYTVPTGTTITPGTTIGIGNATPGGSCTQSASTVTCTGVPTGSQTGSQPIYVQTPGAAKTDSGSKATVTSPSNTVRSGGLSAAIAVFIVAVVGGTAVFFVSRRSKLNTKDVSLGK